MYQEQLGIHRPNTTSRFSVRLLHKPLTTGQTPPTPVLRLCIIIPTGYNQRYYYGSLSKGEAVRSVIKLVICLVLTTMPAVCHAEPCQRNYVVEDWTTITIKEFFYYEQNGQWSHNLLEDFTLTSSTPQQLLLVGEGRPFFKAVLSGGTPAYGWIPNICTGRLIIICQGDRSCGDGGSRSILSMPGDAWRNVLGARLMSRKRRLILLLDGTWNDADIGDKDTNIVRLRDILAHGLSALYHTPLSIEEVIGNDSLAAELGIRSHGAFDYLFFYERGVGTGPGLDRLTGGGLGWGLGQNIRRAYKFLSRNYLPGAEIFIFGFSRGAYTARSLVGYLGSSGLLKAEHCNDELEYMAWSNYRTVPNDRMPATRLSARIIHESQTRPWDSLPNVL